MTDGAIERLGKLTGPEIAVVNLAAVGFENKHIEKKLGISIYSVRRRLQLAYEKLNITGSNARVILAHYALNEGLPNLFDKPKPKVKL